MPNAKNIRNIELSKIRIDGGTQARAKIDLETVADYAERLIELPDADVFFDGSEYWLAEGFHRYHAHAKAGRKSMRCRIRKGTQRDAILFAAGANVTNGLRRTNEDKRRAVEMLLADAEWAKWSNQEIGRRCGVSGEFVRQFRSSLPMVGSEERTYTTKQGTTATMKTGNIGHKPEPDKEERKSSKPASKKTTKEKRATVEEKAAPEPPQPEPAEDHPAEPPAHASAPPVEDEPCDAAGVPIPKNLRAAFAQAPVFRSLMKRLSDLKSEYLKLCGGPGGEWGDRRRQIAVGKFENVHSELRFAIPYGLCPSCGGAGCDDCKQIGYLPEEMYKAVPDALKPLPRSKGKAA